MDRVDQQGFAASGYLPSRHRRGASETVISNPPVPSTPADAKAHRRDGGGSLNMAKNLTASSAPNPPCHPCTM